MKKILFILFSFLLFTSSIVVTPDAAEEANAKIKAIYIYNFTKYIEWPDNYKEGNFVIGFLGSNFALLNKLSEMAETKKVGSQTIQIKNITSVDNADKFNIIYILSDNSAQLSEVVSKVKGKCTLIVTDKPGLAKQGSGINFVVVENKQKIELNKSNIEKYKLKIASTLVSMALPVN
ncbi:MAG: YfiR family protein [Bacteroidota bacterium]